MTYTVDTTAGVIVAQGDGAESRVPLYSKEGFELLSQLWLKVGWNQKYSYTLQLDGTADHPAARGHGADPGGDLTPRSPTSSSRPASRTAGR